MHCGCQQLRLYHGQHSPGQPPEQDIFIFHFFNFNVLPSRSVYIYFPYIGCVDGVMESPAGSDHTLVPSEGGNKAQS